MNDEIYKEICDLLTEKEMSHHYSIYKNVVLVYGNTTIDQLYEIYNHFYKKGIELNIKFLCAPAIEYCFSISVNSIKNIMDVLFNTLKINYDIDCSMVQNKIYLYDTISLDDFYEIYKHFYNIYGKK